MGKGRGRREEVAAWLGLARDEARGVDVWASMARTLAIDYIGAYASAKRLKSVVYIYCGFVDCCYAVPKLKCSFLFIKGGFHVCSGAC